MSDVELGASITFPAAALQIGQVRMAVEGDLTVGQDGTATINDICSWGRFYELEQVFEDHCIAYDRHTEGKYENTPENVYFRPGLPKRTVLATQDGEPVITLEDLAKLANARGMISLHKVFKKHGPPSASVAAWAAQHVQKLEQLAADDPAKDEVLTS